MAGRDIARNQKTGRDPGPLIMIGLFGSVVGLAVGATVVLHLVEYLGVGAGQAVPGNPAQVVVDLVRGELMWPLAATVLLVGLVLLIVCVAVAWSLHKRRTRGKSTRVDGVARHLASRADVRTLSAREVAKANRDRGDNVDVPGVYIGKEVSTGQDLWAGWEDLHLDLWGPRQGKTTSKIIPMIRRAPGICISTSCKRDVIDATVAARREVGRVWVLDPQDKATGIDTTDWYFDPLDFVRRDQWKDGNAQELAGIFNAASQGSASDSDPNQYFYTQATDLLASMLLAATIGNRPVTDVFRWASDVENYTPVEILTGSQWHLQADDLASKYRAEPRTRSNVFSAAKNMVSFLGREQISRWLVHRAGAEKFDPAAFAHSEADTLYLVSDEDNPVARPVTSMLTVAVFRELVDRSDNHARSRLPTPVTAALDEIANVVAWPQLPNYYSTFGSRAIITTTVLQSFSQGVDLWGEQGMRKLFSAATIVVIGPGHRDYRFLDELSHLIGTHTEQQITSSHSAGPHGTSTSLATHEKQTLTAAELAALPRGRMIVFATGRRPILARMIRWQDQDLPDPSRDGWTLFNRQGGDSERI